MTRRRTQPRRLFARPAARQGLYDPRTRRTPAAWPWSRRCAARAGHDIIDAGAHRAAQPRAPRRGRRRMPAPATARASSRRSPTRSCAPSSTSSCRRVGRYAVGMAFLPVDDAERAAPSRRASSELAAEEDLDVLGWREVPVDADDRRHARPRRHAASSSSCSSQRAVRRGQLSGIDLDRRAFRLRKRAERELGAYFASLSAARSSTRAWSRRCSSSRSTRTCRDERFASELALVHSRYSTNTFPSWPLAQPFRMIAHNGEINTVQRQPQLDARPPVPARVRAARRPRAALPDLHARARATRRRSTRSLELLHLGGRSLPHAIMMMVPEAWENQADIDPDRRAFYEYHSMLMEPWDGPAALVFTDGTLVGATLDRNGLRPGRYWVTDDGLVVLASEIGVLDFDPAHRSCARAPAARPDVPRRHRQRPDHRGRRDQGGARRRSSRGRSGSTRALDLARPARARAHRAHARLGDPPPAHLRLHRGGGADPAHARWRRTARSRSARWAPTRPIAVLCEPPAAALRLLHAAVRAGDQPAARLDPRGGRHLAGSLGLGPERNLLASGPDHARQVVLDFPVIDNDELAKIQHIDADGDLPGYATSRTIRGLYRVDGRRGGACTRRARGDVRRGRRRDRGAARSFIVLSDRDSNTDLAPIPSLLMLAAVHHHLIRKETRMKVGLVVEAGDVREVHHVALLIGYGASAVNPYLAMETVEDLVRSGIITGVTPEKAVKNLIKALGKGVLKIMSKMGISTVASYRGAQVFEAIGLSQRARRPVLHRHHDPARRRRPRRHRRRDRRAARRRVPARGHPPGARALAVGGEYQWRREGAPHLFNPETVFRLQHSTRAAPLRHLPRVHEPGRRAGGAPDDAARPVRVRARRRDRTPGDSDRRGRAGRVDRQAVHHRRDELRLDQPGGARDARHRDEPDRRQVQHRRGRRGRRPAARPGAPLGDQAGRVRPVRRHEHVPHRRRRHPDQDGAGRQARRGRSAARRPRSTRGSPGPGTRRPASGSSRRRRTTTSTRSRTSSS